MISGVLQILKAIVITIAVCMLLQVKTGQQKTLEQDLYSWIQTSVIVDYMQTAIDGGVSIVKTGYQHTHLMVTKNLAKLSRREKKTGERGIHFSLKRFTDRSEDELTDTEDLLPKAKSKSTQIK